MKKTRNALTLEVRQSIWMLRSDCGIREIGRRLRKDPSIISRELRRNGPPTYVGGRLSALERGEEAHKIAKRRQSAKRRGKRKAYPEMQAYEHMAKKLGEKWSPEMIANTWGEKFEGKNISTSTLYRMIKKDWQNLKEFLPEHGKKRRADVVGRRGKVQKAAEEKIHISERPAEANNREEIGHLEVDSIVSKRGSKAAIVSVIDRKTRKRWYIHVRNLKAETVRKALVAFLHTLKSWQRKSITMDRGSEFAEWPMLEKIFSGLKVYFCTAYSPHEKGSVERSNRDFRAFFPKGSDFALVDISQIKFAEDSINQRPMKLLRWKSPMQVEQEEIATIEALYQNAA